MDRLALWVMNCLHSTATIILKVDVRVKTASSMDRYLPNCGNEWLASPSHFTERLSAMNSFVKSHFLLQDNSLNWLCDLKLFKGLVYYFIFSFSWWCSAGTLQTSCENKLQHLANEHDTTLWRQHRFLTGTHVQGLGDTLSFSSVYKSFTNTTLCFERQCC